MEIEPQFTPSLESTPAPPAPAEDKKLLAPVWHTLLITLLVLGNSLLGTTKTIHQVGKSSRLLLYGGTFIFEAIVVFLIWLGIRRAGVSIRQLIGGRWESVEDFLLDLAIGVGFFFVAALAIAGLRVALGTLDLSHMSKQVDDLKRTLGPLIPRTPLEAVCFVALSVFAGLFEEIIFRGYLQRQLGALFGNIYLGIVGSAILFGAAHGYQGGRMMFAIGVYGALFGLLAHARRSLRPGMIAHAIQDGYSGLALFFLVR